MPLRWLEKSVPINLNSPYVICNLLIPIGITYTLVRSCSDAHTAIARKHASNFSFSWRLKESKGVTLSSGGLKWHPFALLQQHRPQSFLHSFRMAILPPAFSADRCTVRVKGTGLWSRRSGYGCNWRPQINGPSLEVLLPIALPLYHSFHTPRRVFSKVQQKTLWWWRLACIFEWAMHPGY